MAFFEDLARGELLSGDVVTGLAIGGAALVLVPVVTPLLRPIAKNLLKGGVLAYDGAVELYNQAAAEVNNFSTEAQRELGATTPMM